MAMQNVTNDKADQLGLAGGIHSVNFHAKESQKSSLIWQYEDILNSEFSILTLLFSTYLKSVEHQLQTLFNKIIVFQSVVKNCSENWQNFQLRSHGGSRFLNFFCETKL